MGRNWRKRKGMSGSGMERRECVGVRGSVIKGEEVGGVGGTAA